MKNLKRRIVWDRGGVSEVIGTILTLSITVVLFSSIIMMVDQFPAPGDNVYTDFAATVEPINGTWTPNQGAYVHIINTGGIVMTGDWTLIVVSIDSQTFSLRTMGELDGLKYGLGPYVPGHRGNDNGDNNWDTGERWTFPRDATDINQGSSVSVIILDEGRNALVWSAQIQGSQNRFGPIISNIRVDSDLDSTRLDPIQFGRPFYLFADIYDPDGDLDPDMVYVDLSSITLSNNIKLYNQGNGVFRSNPITGPDTGAVPIGYHIAVIHATDGEMNSTASGRIPVGMDLKGQPNLVINERNMFISTETPTNGQTISLTVTVMNYGGRCNGTLNVYDVIDPANPDGTEISSIEFIITDGPDQITKTIAWKASPGGRHTLRVEAWPVNANDADPYDNVGFINLTVMPRILLVDDDAHPTDLTPGDTVSYMRGALDSCGFTYETYTVGTGKDGPRFAVGEKRMANYDVVIWMTGYEKTGTLTQNDRANLTSFLTNTSVNGKAGSLWLIGQYIFNDTSVTGDGAFVTNILQVIGQTYSPVGPGTELIGVAGNQVSSEWDNKSMPLTTRLAGHGSGWEIMPDSNANVTFNKNNLTGHALNYENVNKSLDSRYVLFPWEFSRIKDTGDQAQVAYRVLNWLGNLKQRVGQDLAVSEQVLVPGFVFFNQPVTVTAVIRNNGATAHEVTGQKVYGPAFGGENGPFSLGNINIINLELVTVLNGTEFTLAEGFNYTLDRTTGIINLNNVSLEVNETLWANYDYYESMTAQVGLFRDDDILEGEIISVVIPGNGGSVTVSDTWVARELGTHVLKWRVDPNNLIQETNEQNNEVPSHVQSGQVFVEFRTLVVDDDSSSNNNGILPGNDAALLADSLARMNYSFESHNGNNTAYVIMNGDNGPTIEYMRNYSAVLWVGGNSTAVLTNADAYNLGEYVLTYGGRLWLSGNDLFSNISAQNTSTLFSVLGIASVTENSGLSETLRGVDESNISHGMNFSIAGNPLADVLGPNETVGAFGVLYKSYIGRTFTAVAYDKKDYHAFTSAFELSTLNGTDTGYITGDNARDELTFMLLRWMGKPETRNELRITERDYFLSDLHPQIGDAYVLRARVHNVGGNPANFLVRFMDGTVQIGSDTISVSPGAMTSAEIIWRPLFAGPRTIRVLADPVDDVGEILPWFNNNISFGIYVYFFWDDMESGTEKWSHASTVVNINGEGPLDYYSANAQVDIHRDWESESGVDMVNTSAHSYPNSYYMEEPKGYFGKKADVLVGIVIDNSPSMTDRKCPDGTLRSYLGVTKDAAIAMVNSFTNASAVGIYHFTGANEREAIGITHLEGYGNGTGRQSVINTILGITDKDTGGGNTATQLWDSIGLANTAVRDAIPSYPDNYAAVVSLGDGQDYQSADSSATKEQAIEGGSDEWAPWGKMFEPIPDGGYPTHWGKYFWYYDDDPLPGSWFEAGSQMGAYFEDRKGLLFSDIPIYTIGLGLEHYKTPYAHPAPVGWVPVDEQNNYTHIPDTESGTVEYNMWRIANTSGAQYFYSEDGSNLENIFETIGQIISSGGFNQTRSSAPAPETRAEGNVDKWAVTPPISLVDVEKAQLSFWHRYKIRQGANGCFLELGFNNSGTWEYLYIVPPGKYTGMLFQDYFEYDDFGNEIRWCWNGVSGQGTLGWDYVSFDIMPFIPLGTDLSQVAVRFYYMQFGGGVTGNGWYIDDVKIDVTRVEGAPIIDPDTRDVWRQAVATDRYNNMTNVAWWNHIRPGNDNYLKTTAIDLTGARSAQLSAYFKFNINTADGSPPDGFRVEISSDGGTTWVALSMGMRTASGLSGAALDGYWVSAGDLIGLNVDLTAWRGGQVFIRFRMVSNNYQSAPTDPFRGFYVDDVQVTGDSIYG